MKNLIKYVQNLGKFKHRSNYRITQNFEKHKILRHVSDKEKEKLLSNFAKIKEEIEKNEDLKNTNEIVLRGFVKRITKILLETKNFQKEIIASISPNKRLIFVGQTNISDDDDDDDAKRCSRKISYGKWEKSTYKENSEKQKKNKTLQDSTMRLINSSPLGSNDDKLKKLNNASKNIHNIRKLSKLESFKEMHTRKDVGSDLREMNEIKFDTEERIQHNTFPLLSNVGVSRLITSSSMFHYLFYPKNCKHINLDLTLLYRITAQCNFLKNVSLKNINKFWNNLFKFNYGDSLNFDNLLNSFSDIGMENQCNDNVYKSSGIKSQFRKNPPAQSALQLLITEGTVKVIPEMNAVKFFPDIKPLSVKNNKTGEKNSSPDSNCKPTKSKQIICKKGGSKGSGKNKAIEEFFTSEPFWFSNSGFFNILLAFVSFWLINSTLSSVTQLEDEKVKKTDKEAKKVKEPIKKKPEVKEKKDGNDIKGKKEAEKKGKEIEKKGKEVEKKGKETEKKGKEIEKKGKETEKAAKSQQPSVNKEIKKTEKANKRCQENVKDANKATQSQ